VRSCPGTWTALLAIAALLAGIGAAAAQTAPAERRSGFDFMSRDTQAMQRDDTANPGMFSVLEGEALWKRPAGAAKRSCADCHQDARVSMRGVAARYPAFSPAEGRPVNLEERVNLCRTGQQKATPLKWEGPELLALSTYVAHQSRGMPIAVADDAQTRPFIERGRQMYEQRQGQLNLSCAACHDQNWGGRLAGNPIPQAHPSGYPIYRLEWQGVGSLQRRLRGCIVGVRAEPYDYGSPEIVNLELYLMDRAKGLPVETPAVRP
jgi:L-cysteine S-thiosulfotransferase